jgi:pyruvate,water dikinase
MKLGVHVPETYVCNGKAYQKYLVKDAQLESILEDQLKKYIDPQKTYAVRSSANLEDNPDYSFAGQFNTVLGVHGVDSILKAIESVWSSADSEIVQAYLDHNRLTNSDLYMAVLIQQMVPPLYSGVALSKNPVTGADEIVVEAIQGEGTRLMQSGQTPYRWIYKWGYWLEKDQHGDIPLELIQKIVDQVKELSARLGYPVDLEWVFDGEKLYWVQAREITTLKKHNVYSNYLSREMMPGMLKPLNFAISAPIMANAKLRWMKDIFGDLGITPQDLVKPFYYRTYFNMGALGRVLKSFGLPAETLEFLLGTLPPEATKPRIRPTLKTFTHLPALIIYLFKIIGQKKRIAEDINHLEDQLQSKKSLDISDYSVEELREVINDHKNLVEDLAYYTSLSMFFLSLFNRMLRLQLKRRGIELSNFDLMENMPDLSNYYPSDYFQKLNQQFKALPQNLQKKIASSTYDDINEIEGIDDFRESLNSFFEKFGHLGDSGNDFTVPPWRETPEIVLRMIADFQSLAHENTTKITIRDLQKRHQAGPFFKFIYQRARAYQYLREKSSNLYTQSKFMFRDYFIKLGEQLVNFDIIDEPSDIFYLTPAQIDQIIAGDHNPICWRTQVAQHKQDMQRFDSIQLPTVIYGDEPPPICEENAHTLVGTPTSIGCYTGQVCIIKNMQDFSKLQQGEVLIIPHSDVSWAPLFARAGALVSESGGLLSHGSIVAREYGIPAIVSVGGATSIPDGTRVTVDAHNGVVHILD